MQNINSTYTYNMFSKLLSRTAHIASNDIANIANNTTCYQQISTHHISPIDKSTRNNLPIPQSTCVELKSVLTVSQANPHLSRLWRNLLSYTKYSSIRIFRRNL